jgi:hypothetical protein
MWIPVLLVEPLIAITHIYYFLSDFGATECISIIAETSLVITIGYVSGTEGSYHFDGYPWHTRKTII